jgi:YD repeat-containing protein
MPALEPPASPMTPRPDPSPAPGALHDINLHSGEFTMAVEDLRVRGRGLDFVWARRYRSRTGGNTAQGNGWDFSYNLWFERAGLDVVVHDGNGRADRLSPRGGGRLGARGLAREGELRTDGSLLVTFADQGTWAFRPPGGAAGGRIETVADRNGNALRFAYDLAGRLVTITDTLGRAVQVTYDGTGRIAAVTDFSGRSVRYAYYTASDTLGGPGDLRTVTTPAVVGTGHNDFPQGKTTTYTYARSQPYPELDHNLLTAVDPLGRTWLRNDYGTTPTALDFDRVVGQTRGNPDETIRCT